EWDGKQGVGVQGDAAWAWLLNIQHTYLANPCIDLGKGAPEIHVTRENIRYAKQILRQQQWRTALLVSDPLHMLRLKTIAQDNGI
ncbi:YdcF family protein, partial [Salmonella enterica subsp. enterica serovar Montevideo]|nr:YdcF family protein [Salmonella enterica subsp. enterica serovar Montevideo]